MTVASGSTRRGSQHAQRDDVDGIDFAEVHDQVRAPAGQLFLERLAYFGRAASIEGPAEAHPSVLSVDPHRVPLSESEEAVTT